jgi:hypothetical protein
MTKLVLVEGHRWAIEDSFETAKNELGLDHNETRSWHGWHRHVSMVMLAFAMMATIRHHVNAEPPKKRCAVSLAQRVTDPLVYPGNPPHCLQTCTMQDPASQYYCMVTLATPGTFPDRRQL